MTDIIERMAHLDVPNDLLKTVDVDEVLKRFQRAFRKLDDLKKFRTEHERRNAVMRWWNNDDLENAQLDAQEVQAEFSKTLGQLMVISMLQARKLDGQQRQLASQQTEIHKLSERIGSHASELAAEHSRLFEQGEELNRLVRDALDIQYSMETERKLIAIASQVATSKDALVAAFDGKLAEAHGLAEQTRQLAAESFERITSRVEQRTAALEAQSAERVAAVERQTVAAMSEMEQVVGAVADRLSTATTEQRGELKAAREEIGRLNQVVAGVLETKTAERIGALEARTAAAMRGMEQGVQTMADNLSTATTEQRGELKTAREEIGRLNQVVTEVREALAAQQAALQETRQRAADQAHKTFLSIAAVSACAAVAIGIVYVVLA